MLVVPHASAKAARGLRQVTSGLADTHGPDAVRDLAEALAADMAELCGAFADAHQRNPLIVLDEWAHDAPTPPNPDRRPARPRRGPRAPRSTPTWPA
jgi:hypothetical protein